MKDFVKDFCADQSDAWVFVYARRDFQNLFDEAEVNVPHLFLDPIISDDITNDEGCVEERIYSGSFLLGMSSDFKAGDYEQRYESKIKPLLKTHLMTLKNKLAYEFEATFNTWRKIEVINAKDYNFDGVIVDYNLRVNV